MSDYFLAASLVALTNEVDDKYSPPPWPTVSVNDGWVGDTSHAARVSDHNPDWSAPGTRNGVVRAVDIGIEGRNATEILNNTIGDPRVWYVIHNHKIYSRTYGWAANAYTGADSHEHHVHVSILHTAAAENHTHQWFDEKKRRTTSPVVDLSNVVAQFQHGGHDAIRGVRLIQRAMNAKMKSNLHVDGQAGPVTLRAYKDWEMFSESQNRDGIPGQDSLSKLGLHRFRVRA